MKNALFWGNKDFRIQWMRERHNGEHVMHLTPWWHHGKNTEATVGRFAADGEAAVKCLTMDVNKFRIQKDISSGYADFGYPDG